MRGGGGADAEALKARMAELSAQIDANAAELAAVQQAIEADLLLIPNRRIHRSRTGRDRRTTRCCAAGASRPRPGWPAHWEIAQRLGLFDLERGAKIAGSGFILFTGQGARLERALIGFMLEMAERHGYARSGRRCWSTPPRRGAPVSCRTRRGRCTSSSATSCT